MTGRYIPPRKNAGRVPRMRLRLFRASPHCFWCGKPVQLDAEHGSENFATVDHLYSRFHPARLLMHQGPPRTLHVLACAPCNQERSLCETRQRPFIPKLPQRLEYARLADATLARQSNPVPAPLPAIRKRDRRTVPTPPRTDLKTYDEMIRNAPDWPTTKALMQARFRYVSQHRTMRVICTLKEAVAFARENPSR